MEFIQKYSYKLSVSQIVSGKIKENTSLGWYEIVAEQVSNLRGLGLSDEAILSILSNVHNGKLPSVIDAVEGWKSSHSHGKLTDKQLGEICRGVQEGKSRA